MTPKAVSDQLQVTRPTVFKWRKRYLEAGIEGLKDLPRSGQPLKLGPDKLNEILTLTTHRVPKEATHWSVRLMAKYARVTTWQVRQVWAASDLKPHRLKTFKISNDPHFADKVVDVVGLYLNPPDNALVLSVDEKTQIHALDRTQPMLPLRPGQIERRHARLQVPWNSEPVGCFRHRDRPVDWADYPAPSRQGVSGFPATDRSQHASRTGPACDSG
jgi:transposase